MPTDGAERGAAAVERGNSPSLDSAAGGEGTSRPLQPTQSRFLSRSDRRLDVGVTVDLTAKQITSTNSFSKLLYRELFVNLELVYTKIANYILRTKYLRYERVTVAHETADGQVTKQLTGKVGA